MTGLPWSKSMGNNIRKPFGKNNRHWVNTPACITVRTRRASKQLWTLTPFCLKRMSCIHILTNWQTVRSLFAYVVPAHTHTRTHTPPHTLTNQKSSLLYRTMHSTNIIPPKALLIRFIWKSGAHKRKMIWKPWQPLWELWCNVFINTAGRVVDLHTRRVGKACYPWIIRGPCVTCSYLAGPVC